MVVAAVVGVGFGAGFGFGVEVGLFEEMAFRGDDDVDDGVEMRTVSVVVVVRLGDDVGRDVVVGGGVGGGEVDDECLMSVGFVGG